MTTYAVTGASGQLGRRVVEALLDQGVPAEQVVAVVRTPAKVADLAGRGVRVHEGDYDRAETFRTALEGVQRLLLVSGSEPGRRVAQHRAVIDAARAAGVERIAYASIVNADTTTNPLAAEHQGTEEVLRASGVPFTLLRNSWYTENYTAQLDRYLRQGAVVGAAGDGRISAASRADFAAAAAAALVADGPGDAVYELGGPAFTLGELAGTITDVTGAEVVYRDLPTAEFAATLQRSGLDEATAGFVAGIDASIAAGDLHTGSDDLARLLSRPVTPLADVVRAAA